jgi:hypothetical protein
VIRSSQPDDMHETVGHAENGEASLGVCKWADELGGRRLVFGSSFVIAG